MVRSVPGNPIEPLEFTLGAGTELFRVFSNQRTSPAEFNPGYGSPTRFAFFGDPVVPTLYAAQTEEAAICETILHDVPPGPGTILFDDIKDKVCAQIKPNRDLELASFMGDGLRKIGTDAHQLTGTMASEYSRTVLWAEAAHQAGFDGIVWMSNRRNTDQAFVFFGDKVSEPDFTVVPHRGHFYTAGPGFDRIVDYLATLGIEILMT